MSWITEVGPIAIGLGGLAFGWAQSTRTLGQQRTLAEGAVAQQRTLAGTRDVLEGGAIYLHRIAYALDPVKRDLVRNAKDSRLALEELGKDADEASERMKVRLGPEHETTLEFVAAGEAALEAWRAVDRVVVLHLPRLKGEAIPRQVSDLLERDRVALDVARGQFDEHRIAFIDAAARTAGANLPSS
jgi:hypothetical protein